MGITIEPNLPSCLTPLIDAKVDESPANSSSVPKNMPVAMVWGSIVQQLVTQNTIIGFLGMQVSPPQRRKSSMSGNIQRESLICGRIREPRAAPDMQAAGGAEKYAICLPKKLIVTITQRRNIDLR